MPEPIAISTALNVMIDSQTFEEFNNEDKMIVSRLGKEYPSAPMSSRLILEQGTLNAEPFPTKEKMIISPLLDDDYAVVTNDDTLDNNGYYQKLAGVWVYLKWNPAAQSKSYTDEAIASRIYTISIDSLSLVVADEQGNIGFALDNNAEILSPTITRINSKILNLESQSGSGSGGTVTAVDKPKKLTENKYDYMHWFSYGQSLSRGAGGTPLISTTQPYQNKTFEAGVLTYYSDTAGFKSFKPLVEMLNTSKGEGETPTSSMLNNFVKLQVEKGDLSSNWQMVGSAPGRGGQTIAQLNKGTGYYTGLINQVQAAYNIAQAEGKTYGVYAMSWTQGENDYSGTGTTQQAYYDLLLNLKNDFLADVAAITGQDFFMPWIIYQTVSHREYGTQNMQIALAQLQLANTDPNFIMACSVYHLPHWQDDLHLTSNSYIQLGLYYAYALNYTLENNEKWQPLQPTNITKQGKILDIEFSKSGLVFDTTIVAATHNKGFDLWSGGVLLDTITSVTVSDTNRVRLVLSAIPPAGTILSYAKGRAGDPVAGGPVSGPRGNLRDSAGDNDNYVDTLGVTRYLHNWCVMFEQTI